MSDLKFTEVDALVKAMGEKEDELANLAIAMKPVQAELTSLKLRIAGHLMELNRESYESPFGKVRTTQKWQTKLPSTPEAKAELWEWMREKGIYDAYATVHAVSLNSLFLKERELAIEQGADPVTFSLPGMEPAKLFEDVKLTRTKEK